MASQRFQEFQTAVTLADNDWRTTVGNPYVVAYTQAYTKYKEVLDQQRDSDKEAGELFVTAACVATGSILLGSIGSVTLRMLAKRTVVTVARRTLNDTMFRLFRSVRKNDGVAFAVGAFVDGLKDKAKEGAEKIVEDYMHSVNGLITPEPLVQYLQLDSFMRANQNCALRMAQLIEDDRSMNEAQKNEAYRHLRSSPFLKKPVRRSPPFKASMAEIIELTFYLSAMLETDSLVSTSGGVPNPYGSGTSAKSTSQPIQQRPLAKDYPKPNIPPPTLSGYQPAYQHIAIERAGGDVQKRTNELSKKIFGKEVYGSTLWGLGGPADTEKDTELQTADRMLAQIAIKMKPLSPMEAIA
ncbi:hypothetical protein [Sphingomonas sp.]|uniref:hypothetical protein n=1 Tax=Sphingomonas sp. TaxID=28214 RepID=UPI003B3A6C6D